MAIQVPISGLDFDAYTLDGAHGEARNLKDGDMAIRRANEGVYRRVLGMNLYNVLDYGAKADGNDDGPAIQRCIDDAVANSNPAISRSLGAIIYFPPGSYEIRTGINIPRSGSYSLMLMGAGPLASRLHSSGSLLSANTPVVKVSATPTSTPISWFCIRDLYIGRTGDGTAFEFQAPTPNDAERWRGGGIFNCHFKAGGNGTKTVLIARDLMNVVLRDIIVFGGNWAADIKGSQIGVHNIATDQDDYSNNGFKFLIGNGTVTGVHVQSTYTGGIGVDISGSTNTHFDGIWFEGKNTGTQVYVGANCYNLTLRHIALGGGLPNNRIGVEVAASAKNIRIIQLQSPARFDTAGSKGIYVRTGAKYVWGEDCFIHPADVYAETSDGWLGRIVCYTGSGVPSDRYVKASDLSALPIASTATAREAAIGAIKISFSGVENLDTISDGYHGQDVTLCFTNGNCTVRHNGGGTGNIRLAGSVDFAANANDTLRLVFDGTNWLEVSRAANG